MVARLSSMRSAGHPKYRWLAGAALAGLGLGLGWYLWPKTNPVEQNTGELRAVNSESLQHTVIVPTLDTPIPEDKSAIWCLSFQLAWNRLKDDLAKGPIRLTNAQAVADRLNRAGQSEADLSAEDYYAAAGFARNGIVERIRREMGEQFPNVTVPDFEVPLEGAVAYAYLKAGVKFEPPFFEAPRKLVFKDGNGHETPVGSFGIKEYEEASKVRGQVEVLWCNDVWEVEAFAVDLCKSSTPNQIVAARTDRKGSLAETLADVQAKIAQFMPNKILGRELTIMDSLLVPNMNWRIDHHFKELEGTDKRFGNAPLAGLYLDTAQQMVQFKMDRSGAEVTSEGRAGVKGGPRLFHLDRPFLLYLKKRDAQHPFFVMWVDNAELLQPQR